MNDILPSIQFDLTIRIFIVVGLFFGWCFLTILLEKIKILQTLYCYFVLIAFAFLLINSFSYSQIIFSFLLAGLVAVRIFQLRKTCTHPGALYFHGNENSRTGFCWFCGARLTTNKFSKTGGDVLKTVKFLTKNFNLNSWMKIFVWSSGIVTLVFLILILSTKHRSILFCISVSLLMFILMFFMSGSHLPDAVEKKSEKKRLAVWLFWLFLFWLLIVTLKF